ncbi:MAG: PEGA domain-containing protein [Rhodothermales bacterium]|nr:PEGA domain-containing protein [Rhodothermales bacterium]
MSAKRKEYYNPDDAPLWLTAHKRRPEFSRDYIAYWFSRYGFVILVCFFFALVLSAIAFLPELRNNRSLVASLDSLQQSFEYRPAAPASDVFVEPLATEETLLLNVASEPSGQTVYIDFDSIGVTPVYRQRLVPGVYVVSAGFSFNTRKDTVIVATDTDSRWILFGEDETVAYRDKEGQQEWSDSLTGLTMPGVESRAIPIDESIASATSPALRNERPAESPTTESRTSRSNNITETDQATTRPTTTNRSSGGTLVFRSTPPGALVLLDDVLVGTTPLTLEGVPAGNHNVSVKKDGYDDYTAEINVESSESFVLDATLASRMGYLVILVKPWGSIYINGKLNKLETDIEYTTEISAGRHTVTATHPTLGSISQEVVVSGGDRERVTLSFEGQ